MFKALLGLLFLFSIQKVCLSAEPAPILGLPEPLGAPAPQVGAIPWDPTAWGLMGNGIDYPDWAGWNFEQDYSGSGGKCCYGMGALLYAKADFIRAVAGARLHIAKAGLVDAMAAGEGQRARRLKVLVDRLELEMERLRADERAIREELKTVYSHARTLGTLKTGNFNAHVYTSMRYLIQKAVPTDVLTGAYQMKVERLSGKENFRKIYPRTEKGVSLWKKDPARAEEEAVEFPGGRISDLFRFLRENNYSLVEGSDAHLAVLGFLDHLDHHMHAQYLTIREYLNKVRLDTLSAWDLGFYDNDSYNRMLRKLGYTGMPR